MNRRFIFFKKIYTLSLICVSGLFSSTDVFAKITEEMLQKVLSVGAALSLKMAIPTNIVLKHCEQLEEFCNTYREDFSDEFSFEPLVMGTTLQKSEAEKCYIRYFNALSRTQDVLYHLHKNPSNRGTLPTDLFDTAYGLHTYTPLWLLSSYIPEEEANLKDIRPKVEPSYYLKAIKMQEPGTWTSLMEALHAGPELDPRTSMFPNKFKEEFFNLAKAKGILTTEEASNRSETQDRLCRVLIKRDAGGLLPTLAFWREHQLVVALDFRAKCKDMREGLNNVKKEFLTVIGNNQQLMDPSKGHLINLFDSQEQVLIYLLTVAEELHAKNEILQQENNQKSATINRLQTPRAIGTTHLQTPPQTPPNARNARNIPGSVDARQNGATRTRSASCTGHPGSAPFPPLLGSSTAHRGGNSFLPKLDSLAATPAINPPLAAAATSQQQETTSSEEIGKALEQLIPIFEGMSKKFEQNTEELNKLVIEYTSH